MDRQHPGGPLTQQAIDEAGRVALDEVRREHDGEVGAQVVTPDGKTVAVKGYIATTIKGWRWVAYAKGWFGPRKASGEAGVEVSKKLPR